MPLSAEMFLCPWRPRTKTALAIRKSPANGLLLTLPDDADANGRHANDGRLMGRLSGPSHDGIRLVVHGSPILLATNGSDKHSSASANLYDVE